MLNPRKLCLFLSLMTLSLCAFSQQLTQVVRGKIIDIDTKQPLIGASVIIVDSDPFKGATSNFEGEFIIENVPIGRISLAISYMGYQQKVLSNQLVNSAKQLVLIIELQESVVKIDEIEISATKHKAEIKNEMAVTSSRTISVDETSRFAGSFNDPARMASNFAGVTSDAQGDNSIVVRGNSPKGIKWRMEGIEIPNPNHFADEGSTGGPINALNSAMLANSDFLTGAFEPEYGNAYSGVLDVSLRNGNNQEREYSFSAGVLGLDLTAEGPFSSNYNGSYLINYRYSSLALLDNAGVISFGGIPKYQDASFKFILPTKNLGYFTLFGLLGKSRIDDSASDTVEGEQKEVFRNTYGAYLGTVGLKHAIPIAKKAFITSTISYAENGSNYSQEIWQNNGTWLNDYRDNLGKKTLRGQSILDYKLSAQHKIRTGVFYTHHFFNLFSEYYNFNNEKWQNDFNENGNAGFAEGFATWKFRPSENLTIVSGFHYSKFLLNNDDVLEPRLSLKWQVAPATYYTLGYGKHSRMESMLTYFAAETKSDGTRYLPNKNLEMLRAQHFVMGIERRFGQFYNVKMEAYYQNLSNVPVDNSMKSPESLINNYDSYTTFPLVNKGTGRNYGLEFTAERFLNKGMYFLVTASVYESKYTPLDGIERNTRWNGNYNANFLAGKEWNIGSPSKNRIMGLNAKVSLLGGNRYTAILLKESRAAGYTIRDIENMYETKGDDIFQANASFYLRRNREKTTHEFKIDVQNITNNAAVVNEYYNPTTRNIEYGTQLALIPNIIYTIQF